LLARLLQTRYGAFAQPDPLLLGDRRENAQHCVAEDAAAIELLLGVALPRHSVAGERLQPAFPT
jgi:hypothetical protein